MTRAADGTLITAAVLRVDVSRDRSLDEFLDGTPDDETSDTDSAGGVDTDNTGSEEDQSEAGDLEDTSETNDLEDTNEANDTGATDGAGSPDDTRGSGDTTSVSDVTLPDPDGLAPLRPTFSADAGGTCSRCGATVTTRWWDDTADGGGAADTDVAADAGAGYVCADCKEW